MSELLIMTWYWKQEGGRCEYTAESVNTWAAMMRRNLTIPHRLACVTDEPEGIEIDTIPLPKDFDLIKSAAWSAEKGLPQCYRRIALFSPDAEQIFGAKRFVSMDMDCVVTGNIDYLFERDDDFVMYKGTAAKRPYNGSMLMMRSGARPEVYTRLIKEGQSLVKAAQDRYLGSDQAIISYVLGPGEAVWDRDDGVYFWSPRFIRDFRGHPPENMRILFFPGTPKPWQALEYPYIRAHWHKGDMLPLPDRRPQYGRRMIYAFNDKKGWGRRFREAARAQGVSVRLFFSPLSVPPGSKVFLRMDQQGAMRAISKKVAEVLNERDCKMLPDYRQCQWYDDKAAQLGVLSKWMPSTICTDDRDKALAWMAKNKPPFVSKRSDGASSKNVKLIRDKDQALAELDGLPYVYWQKLVPDQSCDYRITVIGPYVYGMRRFVRPGDFRASGSGHFEYLDFTCAQSRKAAQLVIKVAAELNLNWTAFDVVFDGKTPKILEMSSSWYRQKDQSAQLFDHDLNPTDLTMVDTLRVAVDLVRDLK